MFLCHKKRNLTIAKHNFLFGNCCKSDDRSEEATYQKGSYSDVKNKHWVQNLSNVLKNICFLDR